MKFNLEYFPRNFLELMQISSTLPKNSPAPLDGPSPNIQPACQLPGQLEGGVDAEQVSSHKANQRGSGSHDDSDDFDNDYDFEDDSASYDINSEVSYLIINMSQPIEKKSVREILVAVLTKVTAMEKDIVLIKNHVFGDQEKMASPSQSRKESADISVKKGASKQSQEELSKRGEQELGDKDPKELVVDATPNAPKPDFLAEKKVQQKPLPRCRSLTPASHHSTSSAVSRLDRARMQRAEAREKARALSLVKEGDRDTRLNRARRDRAEARSRAPNLNKEGAGDARANKRGLPAQGKGNEDFREELGVREPVERLDAEKLKEKKNLMESLTQKKFKPPLINRPTIFNQLEGWPDKRQLAKQLSTNKKDLKPVDEKKVEKEPVDEQKTKEELAVEKEVGEEDLVADKKAGEQKVGEQEMMGEQGLALSPKNPSVDEEKSLKNTDEKKE